MSLTIPDGVEVLEQLSFSGCTSLAFVIISSSVQSIGENAFLGCTSVTDVYCYADPSLTWDEYQCNDFIYDKENLYEKTKCHVLDASAWSNFVDVVNVDFVGDLIDKETLMNVEDLGLKSDSSHDGWYTINGVKLSGEPTVKGVYIHNDRKYIIK